MTNAWRVSELGGPAFSRHPGLRRDDGIELGGARMPTTLYLGYILAALLGVLLLAVR